MLSCMCTSICVLRLKFKLRSRMLLKLMIMNFSSILFVSVFQKIRK